MVVEDTRWGWIEIVIVEVETQIGTILHGEVRVSVFETVIHYADNHSRTANFIPSRFYVGIGTQRAASLSRIDQMPLVTE